MLKFTDNVIAQMTLACNKNCKYCYEHYNGNNLQDKTPMNFETFKKYFDYYLYNRCVLGSRENTAIWHFHGGEIFLIPWKELRKMIAYIEERATYFPNVDYCFQTNGTLVTDEIAFFLKSREKMLGFSFDSFDNDDRGTKEENEALMNHIKGLRERTGVHCSYISVISKKNMRTWIRDWNRVSSVCDELGLNSLCDITDNYTLTGEETWNYWFKPVLESMTTDHPIPERNVKFMVNHLVSSLFFQIVSSEVPYKSGCFNRRCAHGSNMTSLTSGGVMAPCDKFLESGEFESKRKKISIYTPDFLGLQNVNYVYHFCKDLFEEENQVGCDKCPANNYCIGDCQSYNISRYGKVKLSPDMCFAYKNIYSFVVSHIRELVLAKREFGIDTEYLKSMRDLTPFGAEFLKKNPDIYIKVDDRSLYFLKDDTLKKGENDDFCM